MAWPDVLQMLYGAAVGAAVMTLVMLAGLGLLYVAQMLVDKFSK